MNVERVEQLIRELLVELGEDPNREGLARTPARVAKSWKSPTRGYRKTPADVLNQAVFKASGRNMVIVRNIEIFSLCEHHLLPFFGRCQVGYIPQDKVVGVSKIARIAEVFARRLQIQERLTEEIAQAVMEATGAMGVGVVMEAKHLCMMMRGVEKQHSSMVTSAVLGSFRSDQKTREEFLSLIRGKLSLSGNLVLIGMPASGKSTIGILLAKVLGLDFVDTDVLLQKQQRRLLSEILADEGPAGFLKAEDEMLSRFQGAATVVATGGSAVYHEAGMRRLRRTGRVVWIDVPLAELRLRLGDMSARGVVLAPGQTLEQLYAERRPLYEKWADMRLEVVQERLETTVDRLAELIRSAPRLAMPAP